MWQLIASQHPWLSEINVAEDSEIIESIFNYNNLRTLFFLSLLWRKLIRNRVSGGKFVVSRVSPWVRFADFVLFSPPHITFNKVVGNYSSLSFHYRLIVPHYQFYFRSNLIAQLFLKGKQKREACQARENRARKKNFSVLIWFSTSKAKCWWKPQLFYFWCWLLSRLVGKGSRKEALELRKFGTRESHRDCRIKTSRSVRTFSMGRQLTSKIIHLNSRCECLTNSSVLHLWLDRNGLLLRLIALNGGSRPNWWGKKQLPPFSPYALSCGGKSVMNEKEIYCCWFR